MVLRRAASLAVLVLLSWPVQTFAQVGAAGTLAGSVLDPDGKAVVDAAIIARNEATGEVRTTATDGAGRFSFRGLRPETYSIQVAVPGFDVVQRTGIIVGDGRTEEGAIKLTVANITETVTVSAALPAAAVAYVQVAPGDVISYASRHPLHHCHANLTGL